MCVFFKKAKPFFAFLKWLIHILYYFIYFAFFVWLLLSFVYELFSGKSFITNIVSQDAVSNFLSKISLPSLGAPKIVIQTIGICSFFIGWIIKKLDSIEYGIQYTEVLKGVWPLYKTQVVIHFASALLGLWMVEWGSTEGTYLSCALVILGLYPQCKVLYLFLLNKTQRQKRIKDIWRKEKKEFEDILILADQITLSSLSDFPELLKTFLENFYDFCGQPNDLEKIAYIWERIFATRSDSMQNMQLFKCRVFQDLGNVLKGKQNKNHNLIVLSCGYFLYLFKHRNLSESVLLDIYNSIETDETRIDCSCKDFYVNVKIFFSIVTAQCFLLHKIPYNVEFLRIVSNVKRSDLDSGFENDYFRDYCSKLFTYLDIIEDENTKAKILKLYKLLPFKEE